MRWPKLWPFEPPIHMDKSYDSSIAFEYKRINICLGEA